MTIKKLSEGENNINGLEGFWFYVKAKLLKYHGVSKENFLLYLKETLKWNEPSYASLKPKLEVLKKKKIKNSN